MKLCIISDTHNKHKRLPPLPEADVIIHAGDFTSVGHSHEIVNFMQWYSKLPYKYKIVIAGNHDWLFDKGFISFDDTGAIIISSKLCHNNQVFMNIDDKQYIEMSDKIKEYIQYHRTNIYRR